MERPTEQESNYKNLERASVKDLLHWINTEDQGVPNAVALVLPQIERLLETLVPLIKSGGRLFYLGTGTSGRLGILDASECPPTFGVPEDLVNGIKIGRAHV